MHTYHLSDSRIIAEEWGDNLLLYLYDAEGALVGMQYRNDSYAEGVFNTYWFEKNLQGDIVAVYSATGVKLISYAYDAWGFCTTTYHNGGNSSTARYNPFRYRGYYYDSETGFYYLNSRYYDPVVGRFINEDVFVSTGQGLLGYNMFAYCRNNPVFRKDIVGTTDVAIFDSNGNHIPDEKEYGGSGGNGAIKIYRYGYDSAKKLVPSQRDASQNSGLSFSTRPKPGSAVTTIEKVNSTGKLYAVQDGPYHVSVYPVGGTIGQWYNAGIYSPWT